MFIVTAQFEAFTQLFGTQIVGGIASNLESFEAHDQRFVVCSAIEADEFILMHQGCGMGGCVFGNLIVTNEPVSFAGSGEDELLAIIMLCYFAVNNS